MKQSYCKTTIVILAILTTTQALFKGTPEDAKLNFTELGHKYGHRVEEYDVETEDGYILKLFHIPGKKKGPVLLVHGITNTADAFIIRGKKSLAITLADDDYDVWAGNTRGNRYGRRHTHLNPDIDKSFWDFSFHEAGYYDLAATIDFILNATGEKNLRSIGHSQGTTVHFVLMSTKPEYNEKIEIFIALAPVAFLNHLKPPLSTVLELGPIINLDFEDLGLEELFRDHDSATELMKILCSQGIIGLLCYLDVFSPLSGLDPKRVEPEFYEVIVGHTPAGTNRKTLVHFSQVSLNKRFAYYDYGLSKNLQRYGSSVPPSYDLGKVMARVALMVGKNDSVATVEDVDILRKKLSNVAGYYLLEPELWNHVDFVWANDMDVYLYPKIFSVLQKFEEHNACSNDI
ncbi:hypothetical protein MSG28_012188 [Choristoneura fumiferana]|uniref:Uncharacterized protein n=1 Tax=Choristoneura fumiferana TaxID=7141 RepID=A0ACC0KC57_CHOFU|nr:hypothetical protein MSG28_012188 [Choristoneura fumiferana]